MPDKRLNPDMLLKQLQEEERQSKCGKLKIFFGYAAGVGKTYEMLKEAHVAKEQGIDVVCGYVEPHDRPETALLITGLEQLPPLEFTYKGITLHELNLDRVLERKPELVLVDEYAHTNASLCRHQKRYQDINEILNAGIDVYTTVNVQHIESLCDIVAAITGITVRERIPDKFFDRADQVELIDIEPKELMKRLETGKIYHKAQAKQALDNFFTEDKLTALREIALRRTADRVSEQVKKQGHEDYIGEEAILVGLSPSSSNSKTIRTAARLASAFQSSLTALYVETPDFDSLSPQERKHLQDHIQLAGQLGAKIETVYGQDVPMQIAEYARLAGISIIVIGRSNSHQHFVRSNFSDRLTAYAPNRDIYIIPNEVFAPVSSHHVKKSPRKPSLADLFKAIAILLCATGIGLVFKALSFNEANIITVYLLAVLVTATTTCNRLLSLIFSVLNVLAFDFFFITPHFTLTVYNIAYLVTFVIMLTSAFISSSLTIKLKWQAQQSAQTAYRTKVLLETSQLLQQETDFEKLADITSSQLRTLLNRDIVFYLSKDNCLQEPKILMACEASPDYDKYVTENEKAVADWVLKNRKRAGASTGTLGNARCLYYAVRTADAAYGVVGIGLSQGEALDASVSELVLSILSECAIAAEKELLRKKQIEAQQRASAEQLRANLLRTISHDLRTPLTSISGNARVLMDKVLNDNTRHTLYADIYNDAMWLINLVENLLSVTRIENSRMSIETHTELLEDIINEALRHITHKKSNHSINVHMTDELQFVKVDSRLIMQVIINIVDNAIKHTPEGSEIAIKTYKEKDMVSVEISDNGNGINDLVKPKIFDMYYSAENPSGDSRRGLGLGLALCKSIITAHGGEISVYDNKPNGSVFKFTLPSEEVAIHE